MPPPYFPSLLSLLLVLRSSCVLYAQVDFPDAALSFTCIFSRCFVFAARPPLPHWLPGAPPERGAEPRNCLTTQCKLCVYSRARVTGHARFSTSHLLSTIEILTSVQTGGHSGAAESCIRKYWMLFLLPLKKQHLSALLCLVMKEKECMLLLAAWCMISTSHSAWSLCRFVNILNIMLNQAVQNERD